MPDDYREITKTNIGDRLDFLTKALQGKDYLMGSTFTIADAYLFVILGWLGHLGIDLSQMAGAAGLLGPRRRPPRRQGRPRRRSQGEGLAQSLPGLIRPRPRAVSPRATGPGWLAAFSFASEPQAAGITYLPRSRQPAIVPMAGLTVSE